MKIRQIVADLSGESIMYITQLNYALKLVCDDVKLYSFTDTDDKFKQYNSEVTNICEHADFTQDIFDDLNSADFVFVNGLPMKKNPIRNEYVDMLINKIHTKKIYFSNIHRSRCAIAHYGDLMKNKELFDSFDKYVMFSENNDTLKYIGKTVGQDVAQQKYVHMLHPYKFDETKSKWKDFKEKYKRVSYIGRLVAIKDPCRLIDMHIAGLKEMGYESEMRGITLTIAALNFRNLRFKFVDGKATEEKSIHTFFPTQKYKKELGLDKYDNMVHINRDNSRVWVFGPYNNLEGLEAVSYSKFGADFYNFDDDIYGDNLEYAIFELVDYGIIPLLDAHCGEHCHIYNKAIRSDKSFKDVNAGIFVNKDLSNIEEVFSLMNELNDSEEKYNDFRNNCFEVFKYFTDPKSIAENLIEQCSK